MSPGGRFHGPAVCEVACRVRNTQDLSGGRQSGARRGLGSSMELTVFHALFRAINELVGDFDPLCAGRHLVHQGPANGGVLVVESAGRSGDALVLRLAMFPGQDSGLDREMLIRLHVGSGQAEVQHERSRLSAADRREGGRDGESVAVEALCWMNGLNRTGYATLEFDDRAGNDPAAAERLRDHSDR